MNEEQAKRILNIDNPVAFENGKLCCANCGLSIFRSKLIIKAHLSYMDGTDENRAFYECPCGNEYFMIVKTIHKRVKK